MSQSTWGRVKSLLADAAALPAVERERFVLEHCSDPVLRREVLELLASPAALTGIVNASALAPGARLGPYVIDRLIGSGGMGEVYKATDSTLNRSVALKVLPASLVDDPQRQSRFRREAQLLAALNHPNIAHIHGFEESTGVAALVMELVDGPTLADRLQRPMPLAEALSIARQLADALEAAHAQGIIHRDLKPANIKVREDGTVKVLDFGLARTLDHGFSTSAGPLESPTMSAGSTQPGLLIGTPAYMAPEQAVGKAVDKRADIWSFGCVLFEMLAAKRAFPGSEISDTLARVITSDPDWTALPPSTPAPILRVVRRCLEKPLNRRLADIADARLDIEEALSPSSASAPGQSASPGWMGALPWAIAAVFAAALAVVLIIGPSKGATATIHPMRLSVDLGYGGEPATPASPGTLAISPDGASVAFVPVTRADGISRLYLRSFDRPDAVLLQETEGANFPFFSPDGQWVGFFASKKLKKVAVTGGAPITLCDAPNGRGASWGEDGTIVFTPDQQSGFFLVPSAGGTPQPLTTRAAGETTQRWPQLLPGGKTLLYTSISPAGKDFNFEQGDLVVQALPAGARKVVVRGAFFGRYALSGHLLYAHEGSLIAVPFDRERLEVTGPPRAVADRLISNSLAGTSPFAVSSSGALVYVRRFLDGNITPITFLDRDGRSTMLRSTPSPWEMFSFAPDGRRLAFNTSDGKQSDIWIDDWARDALDRVTHFNASSGPAVWTPDGRRITFGSLLGESEVAKVNNIYWVPADGSEGLQRLTTSPNNQGAGSWHPSGKVLAFTETRESHSTVMLLPMEGDERSGWTPGTPTAFSAEEFDQNEPAFSPDGRWLAYESNRSGQFNVYVRPFPGPGTQTAISNGGGTQPTWSRTRPELIYRAQDQRIMILPYSVDGGVFRAGQPRPWPEAQLSLRSGFKAFDLHPDGERLVLPARSAANPAPKWERFELVLNLFDELRRIAPVQAR